MIEVVLRHDGALWRASGDGVEQAAPELAELDAALAAAFGRAEKAVTVSVRFDLATLPLWWRQYQAHYFNYELRVPPRGTAP